MIEAPVKPPTPIGEVEFTLTATDNSDHRNGYQLMVNPDNIAAALEAKKEAKSKVKSKTVVKEVPIEGAE